MMTFPLSLSATALRSVVPQSDKRAICRSPDCGENCVQTHFQHCRRPIQRALLLTLQLELPGRQTQDG